LQRLLTNFLRTPPFFWGFDTEKPPLVWWGQLRGQFAPKGKTGVVTEAAPGLKTGGGVSKKTGDRGK